MKNLVKKEDLLKIGVFSKPHGISGEVLIKLNPDFCEKTIKPKWLFINIDGGVVPFEVLYFKGKGNDAITVKLDTIDSEKSAKVYQGFEIYINPKDITTSDNEVDLEANIYELINYTVFDKKHGNIGIVRKIIDIQQNPILVILYDEKDILIPMQKDFILSIDVNKKELYIQTPIGLIELYL